MYQELFMADLVQDRRKSPMSFLVRNMRKCFISVNVSIVANALRQLSNDIKMNLSNESQMKELRTQVIFH